MNNRTRAFAGSLQGWLASFGPGVRSVSVQQCAAWTVIKIGVVSDDMLRLLAADLGLDQARTESKGRVWWRQMYSTSDGVVVIAAGPHHEAALPDGLPVKQSLPS